jgi:hypothetical protein
MFSRPIKIYERRRACTFFGIRRAGAKLVENLYWRTMHWRKGRSASVKLLHSRCRRHHNNQFSSSSSSNHNNHNNKRLKWVPRSAFTLVQLLPLLGGVSLICISSIQPWSCFPKSPHLISSLLSMRILLIILVSSETLVIHGVKIAVTRQSHRNL